jgi:hypothetical protein
LKSEPQNQGKSELQNQGKSEPQNQGKSEPQNIECRMSKCGIAALYQIETAMSAED